MLDSDFLQLAQPFADNDTMVRWAQQLPEIYRSKTRDSAHGKMWQQWQSIVEQLPRPDEGKLKIDSDIPTVVGDSNPDPNHRAALLQLCPWRTGPWNFFGTELQSEWDSSLKWNRIAPATYFRDARVLDVGCNNGYFGWRALAAGARCVVGCDPFLLYNIQHQLFRQYSSLKHLHHALPISDDEIPDGLGAFDVALSLGVLIHRRSPIDHLLRLHTSLRKRGQLILETMAMDSLEPDLLVPEDRFLKMRGIWFVPTIGMLKRWLTRAGFTNIEIINVSQTDACEQRRSDFMPFESREDFLDPSDPHKTIEGYRTPARVALSAVQNPKF